jgi:hypothetical protein
MWALRLWGCTLLGTLACSSAERSTAPVIGDCLSETCRPSLGGGANAAHDASTPPRAAEDGGEGGTRVRVALQASITLGSAFSESTPFTGPIEVHAHGQDGQLSTTGGTPVLLPSGIEVAVGDAWFALVDRAGTPTMVPTLQTLRIAADTASVSLRGVALDALSTLTVDDQPWLPTIGKANLILSFRHAGKAAGGVTVNPIASAGASVAYFASESRYTATPPTSDFASTVIVRDIPGLPAYPTVTALAVQYQVGGVTQLVSVRVAPDLVTWVAVEVP